MGKKSIDRSSIQMLLGYLLYYWIGVGGEGTLPLHHLIS
jgi:hypothetical protein